MQYMKVKTDTSTFLADRLEQSSESLLDFGFFARSAFYLGYRCQNWHCSCLLLQAPDTKDDGQWQGFGSRIHTGAADNKVRGAMHLHSGRMEFHCERHTSRIEHVSAHSGDEELPAAAELRAAFEHVERLVFPVVHVRGRLASGPAPGLDDREAGPLLLKPVYRPPAGAAGGIADRKA